MMEVIKVSIVFAVSLIAHEISGIDFMDMCFYLETTLTLYTGFAKILKITSRLIKKYTR